MILMIRLTIRFVREKGGTNGRAFLRSQGQNTGKKSPDFIFHYTWCVNFVPFYQKNPAKLAEILHIWKIQVWCIYTNKLGQTATWYSSSSEPRLPFTQQLRPLGKTQTLLKRSCSNPLLLVLWPKIVVKPKNRSSGAKKNRRQKGWELA